MPKSRSVTIFGVSETNITPMRVGIRFRMEALLSCKVPVAPVSGGLYAALVTPASRTTGLHSIEIF